MSRQAILVSLEYIEKISRISEELMKETEQCADAIQLSVYGKINYLYGYIKAFEESSHLLKHYNLDTYVGENKRGKYTKKTKETKGRKTI